MSDRVTIAIDEGVADVRLNRPEKLNALDTATFEALVEASDALAADTSVRAVVLSGEGRSFCAGLDFSGFQSMADSSRGGSDRPERDITAPMEGRTTHLGQQAVWGWRELPVPVIAAVNGHALGGGCQLALGADIRIVHPEASLSVLEIRWGLVPDMCGTRLLPELVGVDVAKELTWTGRTVSGVEARELGLATTLADDPVATALDLAAEIASKNPDAIRRAKELFSTEPGTSYADGFAAERGHIGALIGSPNQVEAISAFFEKRPARFA